MSTNRKYLLSRRFYLQAGFAVALNLSVAATGFFALRWLCPPVLNCWACPAAVFGCPIGAIANFAALGLVALGAIGVIVAFAAAIGRWTCGWACPAGWLQELLYMVPVRKFRAPSFLRYGKYLTLLAMVVVSPFLFGGGTVEPVDLRPLEASADAPPTFVEKAAKRVFFCYYCPFGTLEAQTPMLIAPEETIGARLAHERRRAILAAGLDPASVADDDPDFPLVPTPTVSFSLEKYLVLFVFLGLFAFVKRPFCRFVCPLGASLGLFSRFSLLRLRVDPRKCIRCDACTRCCPQDISIYKDECPVAECIFCNECKHVCPTRAIDYDNPLSLGGGAAPGCGGKGA